MKQKLSRLPEIPELQDIPLIGNLFDKKISRDNSDKRIKFAIGNESVELEAKVVKTKED